LEWISKTVVGLVQTVVTRSKLEKIGELEWSTTEELEPLNLQLIISLFRIGTIVTVFVSSQRANMVLVDKIAALNRESL
jgi:hypothetical protein